MATSKTTKSANVKDCGCCAQSADGSSSKSGKGGQTVPSKTVKPSNSGSGSPSNCGDKKKN
ncbi:MAG: hypothetical protein LBC13_02225 [Clostridiales bacterium]|jgi:hypothetical protein|nr:hypothetical protein [Clostridiales bacterium]